MRFLCDEMLAHLARRLRAAGHDAALAAPATPDAALVEQAKAEGRLLITKDRGLAALAADQGVLVRGEGGDQEALDLSRQAAVDWALAPFTRCIVDNAPLRDASPEEVARMPQSARRLGGPFRRCPSCDRLYWPGSHVRRMAARLQALEKGAAALASAGAKGHMG